MTNNKTVTFDASRECGNAECGWTGPTGETVQPKHAAKTLLCPRCHETTEESAAALTPAAQSAGQEAVAWPILKGVGKIDGDGWKDTTKIGQIVYVWNAELPAPYMEGQFPRIGNEGWSASTKQYDFTPATMEEIRDFFAANAAPVNGGERENSVRDPDDLLSCSHRDCGRFVDGNRYSCRAMRDEACARPYSAADAQQVGGDVIAKLIEELDESNGLFVAMMHEKRPLDEIERQIGDNRTAIVAYQDAQAALTSPAKVGVALHPAIREGIEAAFEQRDGWMTKIAAAVRAMPREDAKVGGDEREADIDAHVIDRFATILAEISLTLKGVEQPLHSHSYHDLPKLVAELKLEVELHRANESRAALSADGGERKGETLYEELYRWLRARVYAERGLNGLAYFVLPLPAPIRNPMFGSVAHHFDEAIEAAIAAKAKGDA